MPVRFYDESGIERDLAWAEDLFGTQAVHEPGVLPLFELAELRAATGQEKTLTVTVQDAGGQPRPGVLVGLGPRDVEGDVQKNRTDASGQVRFPMDEAHKYNVPGQGHYASALVEEPCQVFNAAGWVNLGKHKPGRWLDPVFRFRVEETPPGPTPGPTSPTPAQPPADYWVQVMAKLDRIIELLERDA